MIQIFGHRATKARVEINEEQLSMLLSGEKLSVDLAMDRGYVILTFKSRILGLGFFLKGKIRSEISRKELRRAMLFQ
jgi:NOL1/NOP2/fmu family ribosome biogenesis protein